MDEWLDDHPNEISLANMNLQGSIWYKNNLMPATKYIKDHFQKCVASANGKPYLPHLEPATPEYDVSQVIPIDVFKAHVIALKLLLTRRFENGKRNHQSGSTIIDELHPDPTVLEASPNAAFTLLERLRAENPTSKKAMVLSIPTQHKRILGSYQSSYRLLSASRLSHAHPTSDATSRTPATTSPTLPSTSISGSP